VKSLLAWKEGRVISDQYGCRRMQIAERRNGEGSEGQRRREKEDETNRASHQQYAPSKTLSCNTV
jgi:hypothetical protein